MGRIDQHAFEEKIAPFKQDLLRYCQRLAGSAWDGEDLFQETLLKGFRRYERWPERDLSKPYLFRIAANGWIDSCRKRKVPIDPDVLAEDSAVSYSEWSRYDVRESLEWLMDFLEPRQVVLILLIDVFGFTPKETETALGQPVTAIKSALYRARQRLKKEAERHLFSIQNGSKASYADSGKKESHFELFEAFVDAFRQADVEAMFKSYRNLTTSGVILERIVQFRNQAHFYLKDPDGNDLMIIRSVRQSRS